MHVPCMRSALASTTVDSFPAGIASWGGKPGPAALQMLTAIPQSGSTQSASPEVEPFLVFASLQVWFI